MKRIKILLEHKLLLFLGLFYTIFITIIFLLPAKELPEINVVNDKFIHIVIHIILSLIWILYVFLYHINSFSLKKLLVVLLVCLVYGIIIEIMQQLLVDSRQADIEDIFANILGTLIGALIFWNVKNRIKT